MKTTYYFILFVLCSISVNAQSKVQAVDADALKVYGKIADPAIERFNRLPPSMESQVRKSVWNLSNNAAGLQFKFRTNSANITVKYQVKDGYSYPHMPATGKSGIDLYEQDKNGKWSWIRGQYNFADTISFKFEKIDTVSVIKNKGEYTLYLPLYSSLKWIEIYTDDQSEFIPADNIEKKPVVIYGTSIAQGACASRPGMAWTNIVSRKTDQAVVNLGFSGNGTLDPEIIDYISGYDASLFVLDCMPNFNANNNLGPKEAEERLIAAVKKIRMKQADTPVLLVEHAGYADGALQTERFKVYSDLNETVKKVYNLLKKSGIKHIYFLDKESLGLNIDSFVDGTHPNDHGMLQYAEAMTKAIQKILK